jgi:putative RecB family exonuclease
MDSQTLRQQPHLSVSSINEYVECGLQYKLGKIDQVKPEYVTDALLFGSAIHRVLETVHQAKKSKIPLALEFLQNEWETQWQNIVIEHPDIRYKDSENYETLLLSGKQLLAAYYSDIPQDSFKVLETEAPFSFTIEGVPLPIIGVIDLIEEDEGDNIIITDFKTTSRAYSAEEIDKSFQLTVYHMAAKRNGFANREILLRFDCLIKTRSPKFLQYYTVRTEEDERRAIKKIHSVWEGIQKGIFTPNDTSWKCGYCAFQKHCNAWFQEKT